MRPYAKLRGKMAEMDVNSTALANYLGRSANYLSGRFNNKFSWDMEEVYKIMDFLKIPHEEIFTYFPPNGGLSQKGRASR